MTPKLLIYNAIGVIKVCGPKTHNIKDIQADISRGVGLFIVGLANSEKSSLVRGSVCGRDEVVTIDRTAICGSRRRNPDAWIDPLETRAKGLRNE